jgi:hypothetical protein
MLNLWLCLFDSAKAFRISARLSGLLGALSALWAGAEIHLKENDEQARQF